VNGDGERHTALFGAAAQKDRLVRLDVKWGWDDNEDDNEEEDEPGPAPAFSLGDYYFKERPEGVSTTTLVLSVSLATKYHSASQAPYSD